MAFRKPGRHRRGGKFLGFGNTATGKSSFLLTFPAVAVEDSEVGSSFYEEDVVTINGQHYCNMVLVNNSADIDSLEENLDALLAGEYDDIVKTFGIDSETKFYHAMQVAAQEVEERRARKTGTDADDAIVSQRQWGRIKVVNMKLQQAKLDLSARGIHVVSIAQAADERDKKKPDRIIGSKPDMYKSVQFDYDIVLEFYTEGSTDGRPEFYARVLKDRTNVTHIGQVLHNPTYDIWRAYFEGTEKLETAETSYRRDMETNIDSMTDKAEKSDTLAAQWKDMMKQLKADGNKAAIGRVNQQLGEMGISLKSLPMETPERLQQLVDFTALQSAA